MATSTEIVSAAICSFIEDKNLGEIQCPLAMEAKSYAEEVMLKSKAEKRVFDDFCQNIATQFKSVISSTDSILIMSTKKTKCWSLFHELRTQSIPQMWSELHKSMSLTGNHLAIQSVSQELFEKLMLTYFCGALGGSGYGSGLGTAVNFTSDELNIMRYASGFVPYKLMTQYWHCKEEKARKFVRCLENMAVMCDNPQSTLLEYTKSWLNKVNRGGLFVINDETFNVFLAIEKCVRVILPLHTYSSTTDDIEQLTKKVLEDGDVLFCWSLLVVDLSTDEEVELLKRVVKLWITVRGFSIAASWLESYKEANKVTVKKSTGLRKHLS